MNVIMMYPTVSRFVQGCVPLFLLSSFVNIV